MSLFGFMIWCPFVKPFCCIFIFVILKKTKTKQNKKKTTNKQKIKFLSKNKNSLPTFISKMRLCANVTLPPSPPNTLHPLLTMSLLGRWSTSGSEGGNAHFLPLQEYDRGSGRKREQTNKHEQYAWGWLKSRKRSYATLHFR